MPLRTIKNEEIIEHLEKINYIFIETYMKINDTGSSHRRVKYKCLSGHEYDKTYETVKRISKNNIKECKLCKEVPKIGKRKITEEYLKEFIKSLGGEFIETYTKKTSKNHTTRIIVYKCELGHIIEKEYQKIENGFKCKECKLEKPKLYIKSIGGTFIEQNKSNNGEYFITYKCKNNHMVIKPRNEIERSCEECRTLEYSEKIKKLIEDKGGKFQKIFMKDGIKRVKYICDSGHKCETTCGKIVNGNGCKYCGNSIYEETCRAIFEFLFKKPFYTKYPEWLINTETGQRLELDGYEPELKLAFEYNGIQHYEFVPHFHKNRETFEYRLFKDNLKERLCGENGIKLVIIPDTVKYENLYTFIVKQLKEHNFAKTLDYSKLKIKTKNQKLIDQLKTFLSENDYTLESEEQHIYTVTSLILIKCKNDHIREEQVQNILKDRGCRKCKVMEEFKNFTEENLPNWFTYERVSDHKTDFTIYCKQYLHSWTGTFTNLKATKQNKCEYCEKIKKIKEKIKSFIPFVPGVIVSSTRIESREEEISIKYQDGKSWSGPLKNFIRRKTRLTIANVNPNAKITG